MKRMNEFQCRIRNDGENNGMTSRKTEKQWKNRTEKEKISFSEWPETKKMKMENEESVKD